jgi:putative membrane protein insertion efficiency factor
MRYIFLFFIKIYQWVISPILGNNCRFDPTCSHYCYESFEKYGVWIGLKLSLKRLGKCHPWHKEFGYDPVPKEIVPQNKVKK